MGLRLGYTYSSPWPWYPCCLCARHCQKACLQYGQPLPSNPTRWQPRHSHGHCGCEGSQSHAHAWVSFGKNIQSDRHKYWGLSFLLLMANWRLPSDLSPGAKLYTPHHRFWLKSRPRFARNFQENIQKSIRFQGILSPTHVIMLPLQPQSQWCHHNLFDTLFRAALLRLSYTRGRWHVWHPSTTQRYGESNVRVPAPILARSHRRVRVRLRLIYG